MENKIRAKQKRHSPEEIVAKLRQVDVLTGQGKAMAEAIRAIAVTEAAYYLSKAEADILAHMDFPKDHRAKLHSVNPLEHLNGEIKRRTEVVGIFPNEAALVRLVGAILLEQNDEWAVQRARYMTLETIALLGDTHLVSLPAVPA